MPVLGGGVVAGGGVYGGGVYDGGVCVGGGAEDGVPAEHGTGISNNAKQIRGAGSSPPPQPTRLANTANNATRRVVLLRAFMLFIDTLPFSDRWTACCALMMILCNGDVKYLKVLR